MKVSVKTLWESSAALVTMCANPKFPRALGFKMGVLKRKGIAPILDELEERRQELLKPLQEAQTAASKDEKNEELKSAVKDAQEKANAAWKELLAVEEELHDVQVPLSAIKDIEISPDMLGALDWLIVDDTIDKEPEAK